MEAEPDVKIYVSHRWIARTWCRACSRRVQRQEVGYARSRHFAQPRSADGKPGHGCAAGAPGRSDYRNAEHVSASHQRADESRDASAHDWHYEDTASHDYSAHNDAECADNYDNRKWKYGNSRIEWI